MSSWLRWKLEDSCRLLKLLLMLGTTLIYRCVYWRRLNVEIVGRSVGRLWCGIVRGWAGVSRRHVASLLPWIVGRRLGAWSSVTGVCRRRREWRHVTYALCETTRDGTSISSLFQLCAHSGYYTLWNVSFVLWFKKCKVSDNGRLLGLKLRKAEKWVQWSVLGVLRLHLNLRLRGKACGQCARLTAFSQCGYSNKVYHMPADSVARWSLKRSRYSTFADWPTVSVCLYYSIRYITYHTNYNDLVMRERFLLSNF